MFCFIFTALINETTINDTIKYIKNEWEFAAQQHCKINVHKLMGTKI